MRWVLAALAACFVGMAVYAAGVWTGAGGVAEVGAWLTLPLSLLFGVPLALLLVSGPAAWLLGLASRWRGRRSR